LKQIVEQKVVDFAKEHYSFDFDIVFYDVTTLYFETFEEDELRKNGFSKDNKSQQPQILVALVVTKEGFPIAYEIFSGNTFEGHTLIPVIKDFIDRNKINTFTVVADAAMISSENIAQLTQHGLNYIVGARMGNLSAELLETVDKQIARQDELLHQPARTDGKQPNNHGALSPALQNRTGFQGIEERFANQAHFSFQGTAHQVAHIDMLYGIGYLKAHRNQSRRIDKKVLGRGQKSSRWTNPKPYFRKISYNSSPAYRKNARNRL
jgi:transposase